MISEAAAMWGGADYELVAQGFAPIHDELVTALAPLAGDRFLDVATGTGEVALRAARADAAVTALDFAPALLEQARAKAAAEELSIDWIEGDAQALPFADGSFDAVASNFGVIFAPDSQRAASELGRVCAAEGRLAVTAWLPDHGLHSVCGRFTAEEREDPTERWGSPEGARALLEPWFELEIRDRVWNFEAESAEAAWELLRHGAPPVKALFESLEPERAEEFRTAMIDYWRSLPSDGGISEPRKYLLILGRRR
jgi:ubiquinone/menaquinone biosynthesis C-methylase UbiE